MGRSLQKLSRKGRVRQSRQRADAQARAQGELARGRQRRTVEKSQRSEAKLPTFSSNLKKSAILTLFYYFEHQKI